MNFTIKQFEEFCELCKIENFLKEKKSIYEKLSNYKTIFDTEQEKELYSKYMSLKASIVDLDYAIYNINTILNLAKDYDDIS